MSLKVSVIVPVYNAEEYLLECIESLLSQTLKECEFIFVNDGSNDKSKEIIEKYSINDHRIILLNQTNKGVSKARNLGLSIAKGEYVGFVDADDFVKKDSFEVLYNNAIKKNYDVIISNFESISNSGKFTVSSLLKLNTTYSRNDIINEIIPHLIESDHLNSVWNKIYKREIISNNNILFPDHLSLGEDGIFNLLFFKSARSGKYINYSGYYYREVHGSATRNIIKKDYFKREIDLFIMDLPFKEIIQDEDRVKSLKCKKLINNTISLIHVYLSPTNELSPIKRYKYVRRMVNNSAIKEALSTYSLKYSRELGRYNKSILTMMKLKSIIGLFFLVFYSNYRNR
ncbi:glycosyltransferase [Metabacillus idriensis]|uniref:glycosyltransferase n=1 Tax=Metabacillus idriensis TaxID=324768 RepID=UPI00174AFF21|nr:glycosyltransferase [Metabacillus idriensis]